MQRLVQLCVQLGRALVHLDQRRVLVADQVFERAVLERLEP
jgi:hypothetical protein